MISNPICFSRPVAAAQSLGSAALDAHRFVDKSMVLIVDGAFAATRNGAVMLESCLLLLPRICKKVYVQVNKPVRNTNRECQRMIKEIGLPGIEVISSSGHLGHADAILVLGHVPIKGINCTVANCNGWLARIGNDVELEQVCDQFNPIGAFAAACLATAEIFKKLVVVKAERAALHSKLSFSFLTYEPSADPGFELPEGLVVDILLAGGGAIGSAIAYLLSKLPVSGDIDIVDPQNFASENFGTSIVVRENDIGLSKAKRCASLLESAGFSAKPYKETVAEYAKRTNHKYGIVLAGFDSVSSRHELQVELCPDTIIDGATGPLQAQVFKHVWSRKEACLKCYFKEPIENSRLIASRATGLREERLKDQTSLLTALDIDEAQPSMRVWLSLRKGKPICSIVQEAVAMTLSATSITFAPAAPFVAGLSAAMVVGELIKQYSGKDETFRTCFQFDTMVGPEFGTWEYQLPEASCICQSRRSNVDRVRDLRVQRREKKVN